MGLKREGPDRCERYGAFDFQMPYQARLRIVAGQPAFTALDTVGSVDLWGNALKAPSLGNFRIELFA